jgi:hypothetical protein
MATLLNREATIRTCVVEIKSLTVSGKQVTQALFRQLHEEDLIDWETVALRGIPWGRVNYHTGCADCRSHDHLVWQIGSELRRCILWEDNETRVDAGLSRLADGWIYGAALHGAKETEPLIDGKPASECKPSYGALLPVRVGRLSIGAWPEVQNLAHYWQWKNKKAADTSYVPEYYADFGNVIRCFRHDVAPGWEKITAEECLTYFDSLRDNLARRKKQWAALYESLIELDQLFIAV